MTLHVHVKIRIPTFGQLWRWSRQHGTRAFSLALVVALALAYSLSGALGGGAPISHAATDFRPMPSRSVTLAPKAKGVPVHWSKTVPPRPATEAKVEEANLATMQSLQAPKLSLSHQKAVNPASLNRPMLAPGGQRATALAVPTGPLPDSDFNVEQANFFSGNGAGPAYPCTLGYCNVTASPSVAGFGSVLYESYNFYDATSFDGGTTWSYFDPSTAFTSSVPGLGHFCCSQQYIFEPSRNSVWWEGDFVAAGSNPAGLLISPNFLGCFYYLTAATFGYPSTDFMANPDLEYTNDYMFLSFDLRSSTTTLVGSFALRMPLTSMTNCGAFSGSLFGTSALFHLALTQGAQGTMWFVSDAYTASSGTGSNLNICQWQDPAGGPSCVDRAIPAFTYLTRGSATCASQDGVVTNWCTRLDSRVSSVFFTKANFRGFGPATLGVALTVGPAGSDPFPWVAIYYFEVAGMQYVTEDALFNNGYAIAYPSFAPNFRGFLGFTVAIGGGTGGIHVYPSTIVGLDDPASPTPPFQSYGSLSQTNSPYWGDYNTTRPLYPSALPFLAAGWFVDSQGNINIGEYVIDRGRDHNAYLWWHCAVPGTSC